ncbi:MAG: RsmD family RNA methyltransferase [Clostridia bacterium]|nr:RsmD family RNA methyltransferase [Clostridia bacterium]
MELCQNEHIEIFNDRLKLIVSPAHTFGTDACLLAAFALPRPDERNIDLGAGCGIVPFWWLSRGVKHVCALELQAQAVDQMKRGAAMSGVENEIDIVHADLRDAREHFPAGSFDRVTMNPPYTKAGHGIESGNEADKLARHETGVTLEEVCAAAAYLVRFGGSFSLCLRPERLAEAFAAMRGAGIEPKRLRFVVRTAADAPWLFLLEGKKGRAPGLKVEPLFCMYNADGSLTPEAKALSNDTGRASDTE